MSEGTTITLTVKRSACLAAELRRSSRLDVVREPHVRELATSKGIVERSQHDVLRFQISVHDALPVQRVQCAQAATRDCFCPRLGDDPRLLEAAEQKQKEGRWYPDFA